MRGLREDMFQLRGSRREMTADGSGREAADGGAAAPGPPGSLRRYFHVPSPRPPPPIWGAWLRLPPGAPSCEITTPRREKQRLSSTAFLHAINNLRLLFFCCFSFLPPPHPVGIACFALTVRSGERRLIRRDEIKRDRCLPRGCQAGCSLVELELGFNNL